MSNVQHIDDMVIAQRKLLWPLSPAERARRLAEIRADYEYEAQLSDVAQAMSEEEAAEDALGGMIGAAVVVIAELAVIVAAIGAAIFWSGIWSGSI